MNMKRILASVALLALVGCANPQLERDVIVGPVHVELPDCSLAYSGEVCQDTMGRPAMKP